MMPCIYMILEQMVSLPLLVILATSLLTTERAFIFILTLPLLSVLLMLYVRLPKAAVAIPSIILSLIASYYFTAGNYPSGADVTLYWIKSGGFVILGIYIYTIFRSYAYHETRCSTAHMPPLIMIIVNIFLGLICFLTKNLDNIKLYLYPSAILSMAVAVIVLILFQVEKARWYGTHVMKLPHIQKRNNIIFSIIILLILFLFSGAYVSLIQTLKLLSFKITSGTPTLRIDPLPPYGGNTSTNQSHVMSSILLWIQFAITIIAISLILFYLLKYLIRFILNLVIGVKSWLSDVKIRIHIDEIGYTDEIENTLFNSFPKIRGFLNKELKWETLNDDFARIRFIFKEYLSHAASEGIYTTKSQTPREACDTIIKQSKGHLPDPGKLAEFYDRARYGNIKPYHDEIVKLKDTLL
jgi:hypothetical protein